MKFITALLDKLTDRIAAGGAVSISGCAENFSRPRLETALNGPKRETTVEFMQEAFNSESDPCALA